MRFQTVFAHLSASERKKRSISDHYRFVEIAAQKAKTATRQLVRISDNLTICLAAAVRSGPSVWTKSKAWFFESTRLAVRSINAERGQKAPQFVWKQNALRYSFITYRLAETQDVNRVTLEAGNSPQMIFRHYRGLATPDQARTWFSINPKSAKNVVPLPRSSSVA